MTSDRKIKANRDNARASTGPKTAQGRARVARNALRHGLSLPVSSLPMLGEQVNALAREIAGPGATAEIKKLSRLVAEAQVDLCRVRYTRHYVLSSALSDPDYRTLVPRRVKMRPLYDILRTGISVNALMDGLTATPEGPQKIATILAQEANVFRFLDRYEARARSRRRTAIRALDAARPYVA